MLHLYETFGWWRSPELRAVHAVRFRTAISWGVVWGRWGTGTPSQKNGELEKLAIVEVFRLLRYVS